MPNQENKYFELTRITSTMCIGMTSKFNLETESVFSYIARVEFFYSANEVPAAKHVLVFLSAIDGKMYDLLRNLLAPASLKDKSFKELVTALKSQLLIIANSDLP